MDNSNHNETIATNSPGWVDGHIMPYIIAEAGVNHNSDLQTALRLVEAAKNSGADCVKFQAFTAEELTTRQAVKAAYQHNCGSPGESQYDMLKRCELTEKDFVAIKKHCDKQGIDFLITPFSVRWVGILAEMGITAFKIGSGNITCLDLLKEIAETHLPVIMSTGMAYMPEVHQALNQLRQFGSSRIAVLHCVSLYPTTLEQVNLATLAAMKQQLQVRVGFSDHTEDIITGALAVTAGAEILEKHITLDKNMDGPDHRMSLEPDQMFEYVKLARRGAIAYGTSYKEPLPQELQIKQTVRMSVAAAQDIKAGTIITRQMLTMKRPGTAIPAEEIDNVTGSVAKDNIKAGQLISGDLIK
jgi:N,N'-diacetyllegionaminate synthase